jgi:hypothetical protein
VKSGLPKTVFPKSPMSEVAKALVDRRSWSGPDQRPRCISEIEVARRINF